MASTGLLVSQDSPGPGRLLLSASLGPGLCSDMALGAFLCSDRPGSSCVKLGRQCSPGGASPSVRLAGWCESPLPGDSRTVARPLVPENPKPWRFLRKLERGSLIPNFPSHLANEGHSSTRSQQFRGWAIQFDSVGEKILQEHRCSVGRCFTSGSLLIPKPLSMSLCGGPASLPRRERHSYSMGGGDAAGVGHHLGCNQRWSQALFVSSVKSGAKALTF